MKQTLDVQNPPIKTIGLYLKHRSKDIEPQVKSVIALLKKHKISGALSTGESSKTRWPIDVVTSEKLIKSADCLITLGGDGTMLYVGRMCAAKKVQKPLVGLHLGRLGFLTQIKFEEFETALKALKEGRYRIKDRMVLDAEVVRNKKVIYSGVCLNEIVVHRKKIARIIDLRIQVQGMPLSRVRGDGVIISTPMGSTAYSLSAGGPILHPAVNDIVITCLAPHTLTHRPVVIPAHYAISVTPAEDDPDNPVNLTLDGQEETVVQFGDTVKVAKSEHSIKLIDLSKPGKFFETLQEKLHWRI